MSGGVSWAEFFDGIGRVQVRRRALGVRRVYFKHRTFLPDNVVEVWEDVPVGDLPVAGQVLELDGSGQMEASGRWRVLEVEACGETAVMVLVDDAPTDGVGR